MSIRITRTSDDQETVLRIDGRLRSEDIGELTKEYNLAEGELTLELFELQSADPAGIEALLALVSAGAAIRGASPYIQLLLDGCDCS